VRIEVYQEGRGYGWEGPVRRYVWAVTQLFQREGGWQGGGGGKEGIFAGILLATAGGEGVWPGLSVQRDEMSGLAETAPIQVPDHGSVVLRTGERSLCITADPMHWPGERKVV